jgi:hypothetical protein
MTLSQLARLLGRSSVYTRDVNAAVRGRFLERFANRFVGRLVSRALRGVWR